MQVRSKETEPVHIQTQENVKMELRDRETKGECLHEQHKKTNNNYC